MDKVVCWRAIPDKDISLPISRRASVDALSLYFIFIGLITGRLGLSPTEQHPVIPPRDDAMTGNLLFDMTSSIDPDGFPVTELSKQLIESTGHDVVRFRRNQQIAYHLVEKTRDAYERILPLIRRIEDSPSTEENWEDFERYTNGVDALEKYARGVPLRHCHI